MIRSPASKWLMVGLLLGMLAGPAQAMEVTLRGGASIYTTSRSYALSHLTDPVLGLEVTDQLSPLLDVGLALSVNLPQSDDYALMGVLAVARTPLYRCDASGIRVLLGWGVGVGTSPKILSTDLEVERDLTLWHELSIDTRLPVGPVFLGAALAVGQLSVVSTTLSVGMDL
jgi:hypothetical protein